MGTISLPSVAIRWSRELLERNAAARAIELQNQELTRSIAALKARSRVARDAGDRLGMIVPREQDVVWLAVPDRGPAREVAAIEQEDGPAAVVHGWLDALWQEEALALTSQ